MEGTEERTIILRGLRGWKRAEGTLETYSHVRAQATEIVVPGRREGGREGGGRLGGNEAEVSSEEGGGGDWMNFPSQIQ